MTTAIDPYRPGSLVDEAGGASAGAQSVALVLMKSQMLVLCDISSSMSNKDAGDEEHEKLTTRAEAAQSALDNLQEKNPGQIAVAAFSSNGVGLVPSGQLPKPEGGTPLFKALTDIYPKVMIGNKKFVVISDGEPTDNGPGCIELAKEKAYPIYCIYVGPSSDISGGRVFMESLAAASGGSFDFIHLTQIGLLESKIAGYLAVPEPVVV